MGPSIKLSEFVDQLDSVDDSFYVYLDIRSGEFLSVMSDDLWMVESDEPLDDLPDWQREWIQKVRQVWDTDDLKQLPTRYDIHEYAIMEGFCYTVEDDALQEKLLYAIQGRGAFRRFKDTVYDAGIDDDWYAYRLRAFKRIAIDWLESNQVEYLDDIKDPVQERLNSLNALMARSEFPRSAKYDPQWVIDNQMGPNALWLTEWLCQDLDLHEGMRVLDLGCGRGLSSVFLAKEFGVQVWATDLWVEAAENLARFQEAGVEDLVFPLHADARRLPYAENFFDAVVCVDAYIYFGTDDLYLDYLHRFLPPGGQIGIVVPGFMQALKGKLPGHLKPFWAQECWTWHPLAWWQDLWARTGLVAVETAEEMPGGHQVWLQWEKARQASGDDSQSLKTDIRVLEEDGGAYMGFIKLVAQRL